jgi:hypothetical protein
MQTWLLQLLRWKRVKFQKHSVDIIISLHAIQWWYSKCFSTPENTMSDVLLARFAWLRQHARLQMNEYAQSCTNETNVPSLRDD